ncbi:MAG: anion permease [Sedimentisphaerales bacterium]|nr:anion permease [Sedimentisphaerales bacterium]
MFTNPCLLGGIFLGWSLGANDAANVFGTAVASRIIPFRRASLLCGAAVIVGAVLGGRQGIDTLSSLFDERAPVGLLVVTSSTAAFTVSLMTAARLPISASQAVIGAITGIGLGMGHLNLGLLGKIVLCWLATPIGACLFAMALYWLLGAFLRHYPLGLFTRDKILWGGLLIVGVYGSYALGANNVANATGIFSGRLGGLTDTHLALIGGLAIAAGVVTYSKRVMLAVGSGIMPLDAFTALVAVSAMSVTLHLFAWIGVPVSTSQGIVGAILGIGLMRGITGIRFRILRNIVIGWLLTPTIALALAAAIYALGIGMHLL